VEMPFVEQPPSWLLPDGTKPERHNINVMLKRPSVPVK